MEKEGLQQQWRRIHMLDGKHVEETKRGKARQGKAREGKARQSEGRRGKAKRGKARRGDETQGNARRGNAGCRSVLTGVLHALSPSAGIPWLFLTQCPCGRATRRITLAKQAICRQYVRVP